jgi:hypothetical protein
MVGNSQVGLFFVKENEIGMEKWNGSGMKAERGQNGNGMEFKWKQESRM